jgi:L-rhamnose isomerase/sugar isomerase
VDRSTLETAQASNDTVAAQEVLQDVFRTDLRPLLAEARLRAGAALHPVKFFREADIRGGLIKERGTKSIATGL